MRGGTQEECTCFIYFHLENSRVVYFCIEVKEIATSGRLQTVLCGLKLPQCGSSDDELLLLFLIFTLSVKEVLH